MSMSVTGTWAFCAATRAMPRPWAAAAIRSASSTSVSHMRLRVGALTIWPAPMTPRLLTSAASCRGVELKLRTWRAAPRARMRRIELAMLLGGRECREVRTVRGQMGAGELYFMGSRDVGG